MNRRGSFSGVARFLILLAGVLPALCVFQGGFQTALAQDDEEAAPPYEYHEDTVNPAEQQQQQSREDCIMATGHPDCWQPNQQNGPHAPVLVGKFYAAIAKSKSGLAYGASWRASSQANADAIAMKYCRQSGGKDCAVEIGDVNNCLSLAESPNGAWGVGRSELGRSDAIRIATQFCQKYGGTNCRAVVTPCGRQPENSKPCLEVKNRIDMSRWSPEALASLAPGVRERMENPAKYTNGACQ